MPLIPAPPATADKDTLALRVDRALHDQLRLYAEFLGSTKEYIVTSALRRVFSRDKDFIAWQEGRERAEASKPRASASSGSESQAVGATDVSKRQTSSR
jgi:hypothetical protein